MTLDVHLNQNGVDSGRTAPALEVSADWAPAYELIISLGTFLHQSHTGFGLLEMGNVWAAEVRRRLPHELVQRLSRKSVAKAFKEHTSDQLMLLVEATPGPRDAPSFIDWFGHLTAGAAYEALAPIAAEPGPQLPRDFATWRDAIVEVLAAWNDNYFAALDPAILRGLNDAAAALRGRLPPADPVSFVEEVTNGLVIETSPTMREVVLVPQFHHRPYNE